MMLETIVGIIIFIFLWILKFSCAIIISVIVSGGLSFLLTTLRFFIPIMLISVIYFFCTMILAENHFGFIVMMVAFISTLIGIFFWINCFRKKAIRKSKSFKRTKIMTLIFVITEIILTLLYPFDIIPSFKSVCIVMMALFSFMPAYTMYGPLSVYKKIKKELDKSGIIDKSNLRYIAHSLSEGSNKKEEFEKKLEELNELVENMCIYENSVHVFEGSKYYYISAAKFNQIFLDIDHIVKTNSWVFVHELVKKLNIVFNETDLKIFILDQMPHLSIAHKENREIIAHNDKKSLGGICDCCRAYSDFLIESDHGRYCCYECRIFMEGFYDSYKISPNESKIFNIGAIVSTNHEIAKLLEKQRYYTNKAIKTRHGQAAEVVNTDIDRLKGYHSKVLGQNNAKNGPDRITNGQLIQSKYCKSAVESVRAALDESGAYRYGKEIALEVPKDQYWEALEYVREKGLDITIIRGNITYDTAVKIAQAGNIKSITYDITQSIVFGGIPGFGISTTIALTYRVLNGEEFGDAFKNSMISGLKSMIETTAIGTVSAQAAKTKYIQVLNDSEFRKKFPMNFEIPQMISIFIYSSKDVIDYFNGNISKRQLFTNIASASAGVLVGSMFGGFLGGMIAGMVANGFIRKVSETILSSDAQEMQIIFYNQFQLLAREYLLTSAEIEEINNEIMQSNTQELLKLMYGATDHYRFATYIILDKIAVQYSKRECFEFKM